MSLGHNEPVSVTARHRHGNVEHTHVGIIGAGVHTHPRLREAQAATYDQLLEWLKLAEDRIEELNRLKAQTWTEYEMADAQWTFTFHIHRDDGEDVLAHELAHAVQRFRWPDDDVHSDRHAALATTLAAALQERSTT